MLTLRGIKWETPEKQEILRQIDLDIADGQLTVITGPNGGGKTSLAKIIAGLQMPSGGTITLDGEDITDGSARVAAGRNKNIGFWCDC